MPTVVVASNVVRFTARGTLTGKDVETAMYLRRLVPPVTAANLAVEAGRVASFWNAAFTGQLATDLTMRELFAEDLTPGSTLTETIPFLVTHGFQGASEPNNIAISFRLTGPTLPRPWQWLVRFFGVPASKVVDNNIDPLWANAMKTLVRDRFTLQGAFGWRWTVLQKVVGGVTLSEALPYDVTDCVVGSYIVSPMRRRLPK